MCPSFGEMKIFLTIESRPSSSFERMPLVDGPTNDLNSKSQDNYTDVSMVLL